MNVASYTYQSPSTSAVQVGKLDPASVKEEKQSSSQSLDTTTATQKEAQAFDANQNSQVQARVSPERLLDVYV